LSDDIYHPGGTHYVGNRLVELVDRLVFFHSIETVSRLILSGKRLGSLGLVVGLKGRNAAAPIDPMTLLTQLTFPKRALLGTERNLDSRKATGVRLLGP
jgi:hypothetical protein